MSVYGLLFSRVYNEDWAWWADHVWPLVSRAVGERKPDARAWLDLCCGTGSLLAKVCEEGYEAVGLDSSPHQLKYAQSNAPKAGLIAGDVREFDLGREFDVITCMFDSLNYLAEPSDLAGAIGRVARHLTGNGVFIFDVNTFEGLEAIWNRTSAIRDDDHVIIIESSFDRETAIGRALITGFVREGELYRKFEEEHLERGYWAEEIDGMLRAEGFAYEKYDGNSLEEAEPGATRLLYVCRREG